MNRPQLLVDLQIVQAINDHESIIFAQFDVLAQPDVYRDFRQPDCFRLSVHSDSLHRAITVDSIQGTKATLPTCAKRLEVLWWLIATMPARRGTATNHEVVLMTTALRFFGVLVIYISPTEFRLLRYAIASDADLSRPALAEAAMVDDPTSVSRMLRRLLDRNLIEIERGNHRVIKKISTTFPFVRGQGFGVRNPRPQK